MTATAVLAPRAETMAPAIGAPRSSWTTPPIDPEASDATLVTAGGTARIARAAAGNWNEEHQAANRRRDHLGGACHFLLPDFTGTS